jgi:hypothetical protein
VVFFSQGMCHASFGGKAGRRMLAMSSIAKPTTDEHVDFLTRVYYAVHLGAAPRRHVGRTW